ncbi:MAG: hypothetical protein KF824_13250 [Fimbriimonadaceae bacterium]|nr:MAG: hypothetical protein KF824_13250 [Fimbriimonadaceae bacterium]
MKYVILIAGVLSTCLFAGCSQDDSGAGEYKEPAAGTYNAGEAAPANGKARGNTMGMGTEEK